MTGKIIPVAALMCDDIRHEMGGGHSIIGVAQPTLVCPAFPSRRRAAFAIIANLKEGDDAKLVVTLKWQGEEKWSEERLYTIEGDELGSMLPISGTIAGFDEPGTLSLEVTTDDGTRTLQEWLIEGADPS